MRIIKSSFEGKFHISEDEKAENVNDIFIFCLSTVSDIEKVRNVRKKVNNPIILIVPRKFDFGSSDLKQISDFVLEEPVDFSELVFKIDFFFSIPDLSKNYTGRFDELLFNIDRFYARLKKAESFSIELLERLDRIASIRDNDTHDHTQRVGELSMMIAEQLELQPDETFKIRMAAPLHDIGKVGIPDSILLKKGPLDTEEWKIMKSHTIIGSKILEGNDEILKCAKNIALYHHEKYDGSGYLYGLKESEIPLEARITTVADAFDAMMSKRPYKPEKSVQESIGEIMKNSGSQFDPRIVDLFIRISDKIERMYDSTKKFS